MKKIFNSFMAIAVAALAMVSCTKADKVELQEPEEGYRYSFSIVDDFASTKGDTKATLGTTGVVWEEGDRVGIYLAQGNKFANINNETTPKTVVLYSTEPIPAGTSVYSYYPYSAGNTVSNTKITLSNTQVGGSVSSMPMAGTPFVLQEETPANTNGEIKFLNLASIIEFNVFSSNDQYQNETVQSITLQSDGAILSGDGYLDLTQVSSTDESKLVLNFSDANNAFKEVKVNQEAPVAVEKTAATHIYMAVNPCNFSGTIIVTTDAASYTWTIADNAKKELKRNYIYHYNMNLNNATRSDVIEVVKTLPYSEPFTNNIGDFKIDDVETSGLDYVWTWGGATYGMKASAYVNQTNYATESSIVSPWISLENGIQYAAVSFDHALNFVKDNSSTLTLLVKTNESGATWGELEIPNWPTGNNWTFVNSGEISLNSYIGKRIKLAFKYTSTATEATTWEIKNFNVYVAEEPKTADPVISFNASTKTVTITCPTEGAHIGYTTDGSTPGFDGNGPTGTTQEYTGPFTISETCTVMAFASAEHMAMSNIVEKECVVEAVPAPETIVFAELGLTNGTQYTDPFDGGHFTITFGGGGNDGKYYTDGLGIRTYGNGYFTVASDYKISKIILTWGGGASNKPENDCAQPSGYNAETNTWTGSSNSVKFTRPTGSGHWRLQSIQVFYEGYVSPTYTITVNNPENGTISASAETASEGEVITLTATANNGYIFNGWDVKDANNNVITVTNNQFTMPASAVTVSASFEEVGSIITYIMTLDSNLSGENDVHLVSTDALSWNNVTWTPEVSWASSSYWGTSKSFAQVGSRNAPATSFSLISNGFAGKKIKSVTVDCYCTNTTGPTLTITAGSTTMLNATALTKTTSTPITTTSGDVRLGASDNLTLLFESSLSAGSGAGICLSKVTVVYED